MNLRIETYRGQMPSIYFLNALFDLQLNRQSVPPALKRSADQMQCLFLPVATKSDRVLIEVSIEKDYLHYLATNGLAEAKPLAPGCRADGYRGQVWGWSREAVRSLDAVGAESVHPPLEVVRKVNGRRYCCHVSAEEGLGVPQSHWCSGFEEVLAANNRIPSGPKVIKAPYGTAGHGFMWIDTTDTLFRQKATIIEICTQQGGVLLEPWLDRVLDIGSIACIQPDGTLQSLRHHRNLSNRAGTFYGDWIEPEDPLLSPWIDRLDDAVRRTARRLFENGYWGIFGCDSFLYKTQEGHIRLAAVFEINARCPMSVVAYAVKDRVARGRPGLFRFIARRRHHLPNTYAELQEMFLPLCTGGCRIFLLTPLRIGQEGVWRQPARSAFFLHAPTSDRLVQLDDALRRRLAR